MKALVVGGAGHLGRLILPYLAKRMDVCVFDPKPPALKLAYVEGSALDFDRLLDACRGRDVLLYMATGPLQDWGEPANVAAHFNANVTGLHLAMMAAHKAGIRHAVVAGTMSVYTGILDRSVRDEDVPPDAHDHYGLSKRLGEEVCRAAARRWGMSVNVLRLFLPISTQEWQALPPHLLATEAGDVARAIHLALEKSFGGFEAFNIAGDWNEQRVSLAKAKSLLGWEPLARPTGEPVSLPVQA